MSTYLKYQLPEPFVDDKYNASLGYGGGNLFLYQGEVPKAMKFAPPEFYAAGGILLFKRN